MRAFGVLLDAPVFDQGFGLAQRHEPMLIQAFIAEFSVEALDVCILHGLAWSDERQLHADLIGQASKALPANSGPLSTVMDLGSPRSSASRCSTCATRNPGSDVSTSMARHSHV